jgi:hypothetical protein
VSHCFQQTHLLPHDRSFGKIRLHRELEHWNVAYGFIAMSRSVFIGRVHAGISLLSWACSRLLWCLANIILLMVQQWFPFETYRPSCFHWNHDIYHIPVLASVTADCASSTSTGGGRHSDCCLPRETLPMSNCDGCSQAHA